MVGDIDKTSSNKSMKKLLKWLKGHKEKDLFVTCTDESTCDICEGVGLRSSINIDSIHDRVDWCSCKKSRKTLADFKFFNYDTYCVYPASDKIKLPPLNIFEPYCFVCLIDDDDLEIKTIHVYKKQSNHFSKGLFWKHKQHFYFKDLEEREQRDIYKKFFEVMIQNENY